MNLLTDLSNVFTEADDSLAQIGIDEEKKNKISDEYSNIMDQAEGCL